MSLEPLIARLVHHKEKTVAIDLMEALYRHAFHYEEYDDLAKSAFKIKEYMLAIKYANDALVNAFTNEKMWVARSNLINLYNHANFPEKAMRLIKANEAVVPDDYDTRMEKAFSLFLLNRKSEAEQIIRKELERTDLNDEERTKLLFNLGTYELYKDNLLYGLELFMLEGRKMGLWKAPKPPGEQWIGQPAAGKKLFIISEAGIGDEIINVRFIKQLKDRNIIPIWYTERKDLYNIFSKNNFDVTDKMSDYKDGMLWTMSMTLPLYLESTYETLWYGPYLSASDEFIKKYDWIKTTGNGLKIGVRWQGNPEYDQDLHRSVSLKDIVNVLPDTHDYFSIQRDNGLEELTEFPNIRDMSSYFKTFEDTLGVIDNLDIVITSCTSIAHAAAAMGKRTFILVPISAYYTWSHSTKQSPWYGDNVTIIRQQVPRDWSEPLQELKLHLKNI